MHAAEMLAHGRADTLENWIDEFPEAALEEDPWLHYWRAACRFLTSQRESRFLYEEAFALFSAKAPDDREGMLLACAIAFSRGIENPVTLPPSATAADRFPPRISAISSWAVRRR